MIRPLPESLLPAFQEKITTQLQQFRIREDLSSTQIVQSFQDTLDILVSDIFPQRKILINPEDKPYFTEKLRKLKRARQREYQKHGRSEKYVNLKENFREKLSNEKQKYIQKISIEVLEGKRGSIYPVLKKLELRPGEEIQHSFTLTSHTSQNFCPAQSAEAIADHFCSIRLNPFSHH